MNENEELISLEVVSEQLQLHFLISANQFVRMVYNLAVCVRYNAAQIADVFVLPVFLVVSLVKKNEEKDWEESDSVNFHEFLVESEMKITHDRRPFNIISKSQSIKKRSKFFSFLLSKRQSESGLSLNLHDKEHKGQ